MCTASKEEGLPQSDSKVTSICCKCTSYAKDIAHNVSAGSMWGAEGTCGGGAGQHGDGAGRGMCGECEWGLTFFLHIVCDAWVHHCATRQHVFLVQVAPDVEVTLDNQVVFVCSLQGCTGTCYATLHMLSH